MKCAFHPVTIPRRIDDCEWSSLAIGHLGKGQTEKLLQSLKTSVGQAPLLSDNAGVEIREKLGESNDREEHVAPVARYVWIASRGEGLSTVIPGVCAVLEVPGNPTVGSYVGG